MAALALLAGACGSGESFEDRLATARDRSLTPAERCAAIDDLHGAAAVGPLRVLVKDHSDRVARCASVALSRVHGPGAADDLVGLLRDRDPVVVTSALTALGGIGDRDTVPPVTRLLASSNRAVVIASVRALAQIGGRPAVEAIEKVALHRGATPAADKEGRKVRWAAVFALGQIGDRSARPTLERVLATDAANARSAGTALVRMYRDDVTPLLPLLQDPGNIALAYALVDRGQNGTEDALATALLSYGDFDLADYYLNCGKDKLEQAAETWGDQHGYAVVTTPGYGGGGQWGSGV